MSIDRGGDFYSLYKAFNKYFRAYSDEDEAADELGAVLKPFAELAARRSSDYGEDKGDRADNCGGEPDVYIHKGEGNADGGSNHACVMRMVLTSDLH